MLFSENGFSRRSKQFDCDEKVRKAITSFQKKRYNQVKTIMDEVKINCRGLSVMDTGMYYLGKAYLLLKQPNEARLEFEMFVQEYPNSVFAEEVQFLLGCCNFREANSYERDQTKTNEAIRKFTEFIELHPESKFADSAKWYLNECQERLAKKEFESAQFYEVIKQYESAIVYYRYIIEQFPQTSFIPECWLSLAKNLAKVSRPSEAVSVLQTVLNSNADEETKRKARVLLTRIEKNDKTLLPDSGGEKRKEPEGKTPQL
jgi:outer membrane protein assembly factor BamD